MGLRTNIFSAESAPYLAQGLADPSANNKELIRLWPQYAIIAILAVCLLCSGTGCVTKDSSRGSTARDSSVVSWEQANPDWKRIANGLYLNKDLQGHTQGSYGFYTSTVYGAVTALQDFDYIDISFSLYDDAGYRVGTAYANTAGLRAGETWKVEATGFANASQFKFDDVTCW